MQWRNAVLVDCKTDLEGIAVVRDMMLSSVSWAQNDKQTAVSHECDGVCLLALSYIAERDLSSSQQAVVSAGAAKISMMQLRTSILTYPLTPPNRT